MRFLLAFVLLVVSACSGGEELARAERAIGQFHSDLNAGQIARIHANASQDWKTSAPTQDTLQFLGSVREKMGAFQSGKQTGWTVNYGTQGTMVIVQYSSEFAKGDAVETFTFRNDDQGSKLVGYNINSKILVTG